MRLLSVARLTRAGSRSAGGQGSPLRLRSQAHETTANSHFLTRSSHFRRYLDVPLALCNLIILKT
jgi:hypothetical protein